jgi:hypothetical protein
MKGGKNMTVQISGDIFTINTVEDLNMVQSAITNKFFAEREDENAVIDRYFRETPILEIYDRVRENDDLLSEIVDRAVENRTDYQTLDEAADALDNMYSALDEIYSIAREWV